MKRHPRDVLWGFHPAHENIPLRLEESTRKAAIRRQAEGWTVESVPAGEAPKLLPILAERARGGAA